MKVWIRWTLIGIAAVLVIAALLWWQLTDDAVAPGTESLPTVPAPAHVQTLGSETLPLWYQAMGTIEARTSASLAPRIQGQVTRVTAEAGDRVEAGAVLVELQNQALQARLEQSRQALAGAKAAASAAERAYERARELRKKDAMSPQVFEQAEAEHLRAQAELEAARQRVDEAETVAGYRSITAPLSGIVRKRLIEPGDLAQPGQTLLVIYDPSDMRLEAVVREGIVQQVRPGDELSVELRAREQTVQGTLEEIVPAADPRSRTFQVRVDLPDLDGLYPGMFATLRLRLGEREVVLVPEQAVVTVGQLHTILVRHDLQGQEVWQRRYVTLGERIDDRREVLSGLRAGEVIGWR
ncbi:MAG: efflux RND transporter periplasmic adaptor subunit [Planctomycetota bacterium]